MVSTRVSKVEHGMLARGWKFLSLEVDLGILGGHLNLVPCAATLKTGNLAALSYVLKTVYIWRRLELPRHATRLKESLRRTPGSFDPQSPHFGCVPSFFSCK